MFADEPWEHLVNENTSTLFMTMFKELPSREYLLMTERYIGLKSLRKIGREAGLSYEAVRQININTLKKLCRDKPKDIIKSGVWPFPAYLEGHTGLFADPPKPLKISKLALKGSDRKMSVEYNPRFIDTTDTNYKNFLIESLDISKRAYNCLKRNNINTVYDLFLSYNNLGSMYYVGNTILTEVMECTNRKFGIPSTEQFDTLRRALHAYGKPKGSNRGSERALRNEY